MAHQISRKEFDEAARAEAERILLLSEEDQDAEIRAMGLNPNPSNEARDEAFKNVLAEFRKRYPSPGHA